MHICRTVFLLKHVYDEKTITAKNRQEEHMQLICMHALQTSREIRLLTFFDPKKTAFKSAEP